MPLQADDPASRRGIWLAAAVIVLAITAAYANSWSTPFVFDDFQAITQNPTIRHLDRIGEVLSPPAYATGAIGRPVVSLSLAVNYALGGNEPRGYHILNTIIHALAALALFGIVRRTLLRPGMREKFGGAAVPLALAVALLWALHPLLTESVTFVIQRSESLMGMLYLFTLYGFIRSLDSPVPWRWQVFTVVACLTGMATKEVMVSAPVLALLYDRTFVAGSFRAAWRGRWRMYLALAATWLLLVYVVIRAGHRGGSAGFGTGVSPWTYALTQCRAIILYLRLSFWPSPLVVDYGTTVARSVGEVWWQGGLLLLLVAGTFVAMARRPVVGFLAFWFFAILAPSSSIVPLITQTIAEHRMYLSLAAVVTLAVVGTYSWLGRRGPWAWLALAALAGIFTARRNEDYSTNVRLWTVTVAEQPRNPRAQSSLGCALAMVGRNAEAEPCLAEAVRLQPDYPEALYNLGNFLFRQYRPAEALGPLSEAIRLQPKYFEAHFVLAGALVQLGRLTEALEHFEATLRIRADYPEARQMLAETLAKMGRVDEARDQFEQGLRFQPNHPGLNLGLGYLLGQAGQWAEAEPHFAAAVAAQPDSAAAQSALGGALGRLGRPEEAVGHFEAAVRLNPESIGDHFNLGNALFALRRFAEAAEHYAAVVRLRPDFAEAHNNLGNTLMQLGRFDEAQAQYEETLRLRPDYAPARNNLTRLQALEARQH